MGMGGKGEIHRTGVYRLTLCLWRKETGSEMTTLEIVKTNMGFPGGWLLAGLAAAWGSVQIIYTLQEGCINRGWLLHKRSRALGPDQSLFLSSPSFCSPAHYSSLKWGCGSEHWMHMRMWLTWQLHALDIFPKTGIKALYKFDSCVYMPSWVKLTISSLWG